LVVYLLALLLWEMAHNRNAFGLIYQGEMLLISLVLYFTHGYTILVWAISLSILAAYSAQGSWKKWLQQTISLLPVLVLCGLSFLEGSTTGRANYQIKFLPQMFLQGSVESFDPSLERWLASGLLVLLVLGGGRALQSGVFRLRKEQDYLQESALHRLVTLL
jgi:hypothetical protein